MTNFGPGAVYGIFFVAAFLVVALPVSLISLGLERFGGDAVGGYTRSLSAVLSALLVVFLVFSVATGANPFTDFAVPFILVSLYVVSLLGAGGVVRLVTDSDSDTCLRTATLG
ncbi:MAG: hypothetical protein SV760_02985, partial [Halobacteria archaeon]|nr:hypothetical protein [Halobacteria archaeon]